MKKKILNAVKYLSFLSVGIFIFWWIYKDMNLKELESALRHINYFWIVVSIFFSMLSLISRAMRWNMLIKPMGYQPKLRNTFLSVIIMYMVNLLIPRAGEVARCSILTKYDKVPFTKLVGTVFIERLTDMITMFILAIFIIGSQFGVFKRFLLEHPSMGRNVKHFMTFNNLIWILILFLLLIGIFLFLIRLFRHASFMGKIRHLKQQFMEGIKSIASMEHKWIYIGHTLFIFLMWLLMMYVIFLAYKPTSHLTIWAGMLTFLMGGLAMLMPVQGGIGPWHFMVYETLILYGISLDHGKIFALIAHTTINLIYLILGVVALVILPILNRKKESDPVEN